MDYAVFLCFFLFPKTFKIETFGFNFKVILTDQSTML